MLFLLVSLAGCGMIFEVRPAAAAADAAVEHLDTVKSDFIHRLFHLF